MHRDLFILFLAFGFAIPVFGGCRTIGENRKEETKYVTTKEFKKYKNKTNTHLTNLYYQTGKNANAIKGLRKAQKQIVKNQEALAGNQTRIIKGLNANKCKLHARQGEVCQIEKEICVCRERL